jgi:translation elongation factor EF-1alpha
MILEMDKYTWIVDRTKFERDNGHTTDVSRCLAEFKRHYISFINTPGKPKLIKNRICGVMQADSVLLVLDATTWDEKELKTYDFIVILLFII